MDREEIKEQVIQVLKKFTLDQSVWEHMSEESELMNDLKIKSARIVDAILELEDLYDIVVEPEQMDEIFSIREMVDTVLMLVEAKKVS